MRALAFLLVVALAGPALAAERHAGDKHVGDKRVYKIDSVIATQKGGVILVQAKGAVQTGGWKQARLHIIHMDRSTATVEFVATPPPAGMTVIEAVVPVEAEGRIRGHVPSVRVLAEANEVTAQVLR